LQDVQNGSISAVELGLCTLDVTGSAFTSVVGPRTFGLSICVGAFSMSANTGILLRASSAAQANIFQHIAPESFYERPK
jgi:hypothetical protein